VVGGLPFKSSTLPKYTFQSRTQLVSCGAKRGRKPELNFVENTKTIVMAAEIPLSEK